MKPPTILAHQHHRKSDIESEISVTEYQISTATFPNDFSKRGIWSLGGLGYRTSATHSDRLHNLLGMIGACARIAGEVKVKIVTLDKRRDRTRGIALSFWFVARSLQRKGDRGRNSLWLVHRWS